MKYRDQIASSPDEFEALINIVFNSTKAESLIDVDKVSRSIFKQFQLLNNKKLLNFLLQESLWIRGEKIIERTVFKLLSWLQWYSLEKSENGLSP